MDATTLNNYTTLSSCGRETDHQKFHLALGQSLLEMIARECDPQSTQKGRLNIQATEMTRPDA
jgi:hypothetical protein